MNKVLHVLVYVFLALAAAALWFELQLNDKRAELTERNAMLNESVAKLARTIEKDTAKEASFEIKKDASPVEARIVDSPEMDNVLESYKGQLEQANLSTYELNGGSQIEKPALEKVFESAKGQQGLLNTTRSALSDLREKLEGNVNELNKLKTDARQDKVTIEEQKTKMAKLEEEKTALENQVTKIKGQIDELNGEIVSLKDEVSTAKDETEAEKEKVAKAEKLVEQLKKLLQQSIQTKGGESSGSGTAVTSLPSGEKGKVVVADNENMFAIVAFSDETMKQLKGEDLSKALPAIEFGVKRTGFQGAAGEFVGRIRLRQEVTGKNYVICDIIGSWEQDKLQAKDIVYAD